MHVSFAHLILEDRESSLLRRYSREVRYVLETSASLFSASFQMRSQLDHTLPSITAILVWYRALCCHLHNLSTTISCDLLTCPLTSTSHFVFHSLALHKKWPYQVYQRSHLMPVLHLLPLYCLPLQYHCIQETY